MATASLRCRCENIVTRAILVALLLLQLQTSHTHAQSNLEPFFARSRETYHVFENFNTSLRINSDNPIEATDQEDDPITYYIPNGGIGYLTFRVETVNGSGYLYFLDTVSLDRESIETYNVRVFAQDGQDHGETPDRFIDITVELDDINDVTPDITNLPHTRNVSEGTDPNTELYHVMSQDDDAAQNGLVTYRIVNVDPLAGLNKFSITSASGQLYLSQSLDYEGDKTYVITIEAQDRGAEPRQTSGLLTLTVTDINDNPPEFSQTMYSNQIYENATQGSLVLTVSAIDLDRMIDDRIVYSFNSTVPLIGGVPAFAINSSTGDITVNAPLDSETGPTSYSLFVQAVEANDPSMKAAVPVTIDILDLNDNPPKFVKDEYNSSLSESSNIGADVVTVMASDPDSGLNGQFEFELLNLLATPFPFNITTSPDGQSGTIQLTGSLDYESYQIYRFEVLAVEVVNQNRKTATATVTVDVINENDNDPIFSQLEYAANVSENAGPGEFVTQVFAMDDDLGSFGVVYYTLVNDYGKFSINRTSGIISTIAPIDFEEDRAFSLSVIANDSASSPTPQKSQKVLVQVTVLDQNDNGPVIVVNGSTMVTTATKSLEEAQAPGQLVFVLDAIDEDEFPNNQFDYFLKVLSPTNLSQVPFEFSTASSNQLVTRVMFDYETVKEYVVRLYVTDVGDLLSEDDGVSESGSGSVSVYQTVTDLPADHVDFIDLTVVVIDENDNHPVFTDNVTAYAFDVVEEEPNGTFVGTVKARDRDSGLFGTVRYFLSGVDHQNFSIDPVSGNITTSGPIDRERKGRFDLIVTAYDLDPVQSLSSTAALTITVVDINDNYPIFGQPIYYDNDIVENTGIISIRVSATDSDSGSNQDLTYSIAGGNDGDTFVIDTTADGEGLISLGSGKILDRETIPDFHLLIQATDNGMPSKTGNATVVIVLQDVDDNDPTFPQSTYVVNITEDTGSGSFVVQVHADDPDYGANGVVRYQFDPTNSLFRIDETDGVITTDRQFDYETQQRSYTVMVRADDNGDMGSPGYTDVVVNILDVNDNSPVFSPSSYQVTVDEDLESEATIRRVTASDADSGTNEMITFIITDVQTVGSVISTDEQADNLTDLFSLEPDTGVLYLSEDRELDYESVKSYNVYITAVDGGTPSMNGSTVVTITVTDINDNPPVLSSDSYQLSLSESTRTGSAHNLLISYTDADSGNNAAVTYSLEGTNVFTINPSTGVLTLVSSLDYETEKSLSFTVVVTDRGLPAMNDTATVFVNVTDSNDNRPIFSTPLTVALQVAEGNHSNLELFKFNATDMDSGSYGRVSYAITSVSETGIFTIDSTEGLLYVNALLDRETEDQYSLVITASDGGSPAQTATASVTVTVLDINEEPPQFSVSSYSYNINENVPAPMALVTVSANDNDFGPNGTVYYRLSNDTLVSIASNGTITSRAEFDYEQMHSFSVDVIAYDGGSPSLSSQVTLTVTINDLNDNSPTFQYDSYGPYQLSEDTSVGYHLATVNATDADSGANQDLSYVLENGGGRFAIDTNDGRITLVSGLDREIVDFYMLTVKAYDHGNVRMTSTVSLNVTVLDINDNSPLFLTADIPIQNVNENATEGTIVFTLRATDSDLGSNGTVQFDITTGNTGNVFNVTTVYRDDGYDGRIAVAGLLDYDITPQFYNLRVRASDMGATPRTSVTNVVVSLVNVNDNRPRFLLSPPTYSFQVSEVATPGTSVGIVQATDDDLGTFGQIASYSFATGTPEDITGNFTISASSGLIALSSGSTLDYEARQQFSFSVVATDSGGLSSTASVVVNVLDYNDNQPTFDSSYYNGTVSENRPVDSSVITVHASDSEGNEGITYSIVDGAFSSFKINATSGLISTTVSLNREERATYVLRVQATDTGGSPLSGFTQVEINVLDVNDNPPQFTSSTAEYSLVETAPVTTVLDPVLQATDSDIGTNSDITYYVSGEGVPSVFDIDPNTGFISLQSSLNYETKQNYSFVLYAMDGGSPSLTSSNVSVTVFVLDFNDNTPRLSQDVYNRTVSEDFSNGNLLLEISATDEDVGSNSQISYSIIEVEGIVLSEAPFRINNQSGEIFTTDSLDYEQYTSYTLTVRAEDNGTPRKSSTGTVLITVLDINDNNPLFTTASFTHSVNEVEVGIDGLYLLTVTANDNDGTSPNNLLTYNITAGNDDNTFELNTTTGEIRAIKSLDYETTKSYTLTVMAQDNPIDSTLVRTNSTQVTINVQDVNDNSPIWQDTIYRIGSTDHYSGIVSEAAGLDTTVLYVRASDEDSNAFGAVSYSFITSTVLFFINDTGRIYTNGGLDSDVVNQYNFTIEARDGGSPPRTATALVTITVADVNDKIPSFISSFFTETISEDTPVDSEVITLTAVDSDSTDLIYSIIEGNDLDFFRINSSSGVVEVNSVLDREEEEDIQMIVMVTDGSFNATTNLLITLTDVNDNAPQFLSSHYYASIIENTVSGPVLLFNTRGNTTRIEAIDDDKAGTPASIVVYNTAGPNSDYLNIDPQTAVLTVASGAQLNYEANRTVDVLIVASDSVDVPSRLSSNVTITITVLDANDLAPEFTSSSYAIALPENTIVNTKLSDVRPSLNIEARDDDTGLGGLIEYSIISSTPILARQLFEINSTNGEITLVGQLDREADPVINLTLMARDSITPYHSATTSLIISLEDVNDNAPQFNQSIYQVSIKEDAPIGTDVLTVNASDSDISVNAEKRFTLLTLSDKFTIIPNTGKITTSVTLDHETDPTLEFLVEVCDLGTPVLCSNGTVIVTVVDLNDGTPQFDYSMYRTSLCNDTQPNSVVLHVIATDTDSGLNGEISYSIVGGNLSPLLSLSNTSGQMFLETEIDPSDVDSVLSFQVQATDGGSPPLSSTTNVEINICDRDSEVIAFNQSYYYGDLAENESPPVVVATVMAQSPYGPMNYSIVPSNSPLPFNISSSGVVSTTESLDKESRASYTLLLEAVDNDSPPNTAYATLTVFVRDVNDNPPLFLLTPYSFTITEEETTTVVIGSALAIDPDQPLAESGVTYTLDPSSNPNGAFKIDMTNGSITATKPIDREVTNNIRLNILATDLDPQDQRITTATAFITVLDINDNPPIFGMQRYSTSISEDTPPNFSIGRVVANDSDINENQRVTYSIVSGSNGKFILESNFGILSTAGQLDYETTSFYNLTIKAQDAGVPSMSATAYFEIYIEDVNDCTPQFNQSSYTIATLPEDSAPGMVLFDIDATDCDSGQNSNVTFSVTGGDSSIFSLDPWTGVLTLKGLLDYETTTFYSFEVKATDLGTPPLFSLTTVSISIADVNDETPMFIGEPYSSNISEDATIGFILLTVLAIDDDQSSINNQISFTFASGNEFGHFDLNSKTGAIEVDTPLDRETTDSYYMVILATDNGSPPRSSNTTVSIIILDVNDNVPEFTNLPAAPIKISENSSNAMDDIFVVMARDDDIGANAQLRYELNTFNDVFAIGPEDGIITRYGVIDYEEVKSYQLSIQVSDSTSPFHTVQQTLVIEIEDINDNSPIFTQPEYVGIQAEETEPGAVIVAVLATDADDSDKNSAITYFITDCTNCNDQELFAINSTSGEITNLRRLDREENSWYRLTVLAVNLEATPSLNASASVMITITDINDHAPVFNQSIYTAVFSELIAYDSYVLTVLATDGDQPNTDNSEVRYFITTTIANNPFRLDESTGQLFIAGTLDIESIPSYIFTVQASDGGNPSMSTNVNVTVTLTDENDQPPQFVEKTKTVRVGEELSTFPHLLWQAAYTDIDYDASNRISQYGLIQELNGTQPIDFPLVYVNSTSGQVLLTGPLDYETTKSLTVSVSVNNTVIGVGELCGGGLTSECTLWDTAVLNVQVSDYNDNPPVLARTSYTSQVSTNARTGTQIIQIQATDRDTQNDYGTVRYRLVAGSSQKFQVDSMTGWITTRGTFTNNDGDTFRVTVEAYDNLGNAPSFSRTATVDILAIGDFKRVLILFNLPLSSFTVEKEQFITQTLANLTGYNIIVEDMRSHVLGDSGEIDNSKTDFIFHAVDPNTGEIVDFDVFIARLNIDELFRVLADCNPESITSLQLQSSNEPVETIMIFLIVLCFILIVGAIVTLILACQQRYIAQKSMMKNRVLDVFYGNPDPSFLEGGIMPRDFSGESFELKGKVTKNTIYTDPYLNLTVLDTSGAGSSVGDASSMQHDNPLYGEYADEELRVDLFQPPSDDETEGDIDEGRLLHAAIHEEDEYDDNDSATLI